MYCGAVSCMAIPLRFSPNPSAAGKPSQFVHGAEHGALRNIAGDFYFSYLARQNEMHDAILRLLVGLQARQNLAGADVYFGQATEAQDCIGDAACGNAV